MLNVKLENWASVWCPPRPKPEVLWEALVIRESAKLSLGFAPWGQKAFSAREPGAAEVYSEGCKGSFGQPSMRRDGRSLSACQAAAATSAAGARGDAILLAGDDPVWLF